MKRKSAVAVLLIGVFLVSSLLPSVIAAADPADFSIPNGHFFKQTNGSGGSGDFGYAVTDDERIPFWTVYQRLGGPAEIGYPMSQRFQWNGATAQAFQKAVLQWNPQTQSVAFVNIFDELSRAGRDGWLTGMYKIPPPEDFGDAGKPWDEIVKNRLELLNSFPKLKARYEQSVDPLTQYGLPVSRVVIRNDAFVVRFQRAVIEEWLVDQPHAKAGEVTVANGGDILKQAGLIPASALTLQLRPHTSTAVRPAAPIPTAEPTANPVYSVAPRAVLLPPLRQPPARFDRRAWRVVLDPGHGGSETGAVRSMGNGLIMAEKNLNLIIGLRTAQLLRNAGIEVALTRDTDREVNVGRYDLNRDGRVSIADDLQARAEIANQFGADIFVSIHNNGHGNPAQYGTEVYYNAAREHSTHNRALAWYLQQRIVQLVQMAGYPTRDRGIKTDLSAGHGGYFAVLGPQSRTTPSPSRMPAALTESLFVSSYYDSPWLAREEVLDAIARGHAEGVIDYLEWSQRNG